jgi:hypothetical protein
MFANELNKDSMDKKKQIEQLYADALYNDEAPNVFADRILSLFGVSNCNAKKDTNIVKTYALITRKDGLTDVWCEGKCLGEGLDTGGINKLNLK